MGWATLISPVVPGGAVLWAGRPLLAPWSRVERCCVLAGYLLGARVLSQFFAEAEGGSSVGEQRGRGRALRARCACASAARWRAMADRRCDVSRTAWYVTNRCIAASTSDQVLAPAGLFANKSSRSAGHCTGIAASQSTSVGSSRSTKGGEGKAATRTTSADS